DLLHADRHARAPRLRRPGVGHRLGGAGGAWPLHARALGSPAGLRDVLALRGGAVAAPLPGGVHRMRAGRLLAAVALALSPAEAAACASCMSSGFGDRSYNWPYFTLIAMPFLVAGVIGTVLYRHQAAPPADPPSADSAFDKETT